MKGMRRAYRLKGLGFGLRVLRACKSRSQGVAEMGGSACEVGLVPTSCRQNMLELGI